LALALALVLNIAWPMAQSQAQSDPETELIGSEKTLAAPSEEETEPGAPDAAEDAEAQDPATLISADEVVYDQDLGIITARGNVELSREGRILLADTVSYNTRNKVVSASGNVSLLEPGGDIIFGNYVELTDDMREGFIQDVRVLLADDSRIAADTGLRSEGDRTVYRRAVYSPCQLCRDDPDRAPLWQINAEKVVHDQEEHRIRYRNAWLEMFGVPALYTPYMSHPDPSVDRASGFLSPTFGLSEALGGIAQFPYYWAISPTTDATFEPILTTKQGIVLAGEFRQLLPYGKYRIKGSGTIADRENDDGSISNDVLRGHLDASARFDINETWRSGIDVERTTDDTYLRLYSINRDAALTSNAFVEGLRGRSYAAANAYVYQGLRARDRNRELPIVLPMLDYNYVSEPLVADSRVKLDANLAVLTRPEGRDTRRLALQTRWEVPFVDPIGGLYTASANLATDGYWTEDFDPDTPDEIDPAEPTDTELAGRIFPQAALQWRYPWVSHGEALTQVVQPVAQVVVARNGGNPEEIPNEDSLDFEFDDTNLFSLNRFPGIDRVDPGQRIDYGLLWQGQADYGGSANTFLGQSFRLGTEKSLFEEDSGVREKLSDIVGRVGMQPFSYTDLLYRFRLDKDSFAPRRNEVDLITGPPALNLRLTYLFAEDSTATTTFGKREEVRVRIGSQFNQYWSGFVSSRRDLRRDAWLINSVGLDYEDECFLFRIAGTRRFFVDRDIENEDSIFFQISFKHLGGLDTRQTVRGGLGQ
jgi:LPS-assembly protein